MRILHVIPGDDTGSSMVFSKRDVDQVRSTGIDTRTFFLKTRTRPILLLQEWFRLRREVRAFRPDIFHAQYGTVTAIVTALSAGRTPLVITFHSAELQAEPSISVLREKAGHLLSQIAAVRADAIVCVSEELKDLLWWRRNRVKVIPSSVDLEHFRPQEKEFARRELGWSPEDSIVLFYEGRNPKTKRPDRAQATLEAARAVYGPITLKTLGSDEDPQRIPIYLNAADCLLCTSDSEGSPTIIKEAMACNLPVVSVDVGDVRQRLAPVQNSYVRERDPQALATSLVSVLRSGQRSDGRRHVGDVTSTVCRDRLIGMYQSVLNKIDPLG